MIDHGHPPGFPGSTPSILPSRVRLPSRPRPPPRGRAGTDPSSSRSRSRSSLAACQAELGVGWGEAAGRTPAPGISIFLSVPYLSAAHPAGDRGGLVRACRRSAFGSRGEKCCLCSVMMAPRKCPVEARRLGIGPKLAFLTFQWKAAPANIF